MLNETHTNSYTGPRLNILATNQEDFIMWHRNCYVQYTSKKNIQRLEKKHVASGSNEAPRNKTSTSPRQTRIKSHSTSELGTVHINLSK